MAPRTQYVRAHDGVSIAYQVVGEGERDIVFVPQTFSAVEALWEHPTVARFFDRLGGLGRVILYDRRGTGMSDRTSGTATLEEQVDDVRAVMDAAGATRADLIAIMEGAPMAMLFAASAPERVRSLTLYAAFARSTWAPDYPAAWSAEERAAAMQAMAEHWGEGDFVARFAPSHLDDARLRDWLGRLQRMALGPGEAALAMELNGRLDVRHVLATIRVPTLLLHRTDDAGIGVAHSRYLADHIPGARLVELEGRDTLPFLGDSAAVVGEIDEFLTGDRRPPEHDRVLATVLFTDIVDSTVKAAALGDEPWRDLLAEHDRLVRVSLRRHRGREIKTVGDGFLALFDGPARAVRAARSIVSDVTSLGVEVRAGLHTGEVELVGDDVAGLAVHIAARVMGEAPAGRVLASSTVHDLVVGSGLRFEDRGRKALRGVPGEWGLWEVTG
ncbi:MAG TPA: alpha/beta fold hydrolase [Solirubrobacteraceae bacterium]|nr:alpha/beta fold hydrolase [Solirubrobacteraceae bacterium]